MVFPDAVFLPVVCTSMTFIVSSLYFQFVTICEYTQFPLLAKFLLSFVLLAWHFSIFRLLLELLVQEAEPLMFLTALIVLVLSGGLFGLAYSTYKKFKSRKEDYYG